MTPASHPGLVGICLSGAGPTILCLATHNFEKIAQYVMDVWKSEAAVSCWWKVLEVNANNQHDDLAGDHGGSTTTEIFDSP